MNKKPLTVLERIKAPTPVFFKKLRNIGILVTAAAAVILTSPVALPTLLSTLAGYLAVASGVVTAISQTAVEQE